MCRERGSKRSFAMRNENIILMVLTGNVRMEAYDSGGRDDRHNAKCSLNQAALMKLRILFCL